MVSNVVLNKIKPLVQGYQHRKKLNKPVAEFKEFERRYKFKSRFKYGLFHFKLYQMFQNLSRRWI